LGSSSLNLSGLPSHRMSILPSGFFLTMTGFLGYGRLPCSFSSWNSLVSKRTV
jgi:hypothetical protein